jgi:nucleotide-binding universal stress UspA family protein
VNELAERKRALLARSESYRQSIRIEVDRIEEATAWIPKALRMARAAAALVMIAAPFAGALFGRKRGVKRRVIGGIASKVLAGLKLFRLIKPLWERSPREKE